MSATPDSRLANPEQRIADLERQLAEREAELAECKAERDEALQRETATGEVLQVINSSPGDLAPVFDAILEKALSLCEAGLGTLARFDREAFHWAAARGVPEPYLAAFTKAEGGYRPTPGLALYRLLHSREDLVHVEDITAEDANRSGNPDRLRFAELTGARTAVWVALRKDDAVLGALVIYRKEVRPFSDKQIALLQNFAAQAVVAMENARFITETREALELQTATAEILQVINSSPGDLVPVFDAVLDRAMRLCAGSHAALELYDSERMHAVAVHGASDMFAETLRSGYPATDSPASRALLEGGRFAEIADAAQIDHVAFQAAAKLDEIRTVLFVPLRRDGAFLGMIASARREVRPFSEKEIALLENFAAQAVIAMENARLLTETREALDQQTATAEVLGVINSSPGDLVPVFDAMLEKATQLCEAVFGLLFTYNGESIDAVAFHNIPQDFAEFLQRGPVIPAPQTTLFRAIQERKSIQIPDVLESVQYREGDPFAVAAVEGGAVRTVLSVPLLKDDILVGVIGVYRQEVRTFSDKQIALLENFAAQAVIAMENARLLDELRQRTEEVAELNRGLEARVAEQVEELGRVGRLKRFLAPQLAELIVSQGDEKVLESHRREIVVVFCDLRGYTAFTETAEPEEVLDFLREYHGALGPLVSQFEGTLDQFSGDGIMVFFNDPVPIPDPAERAVKMAMAMREAAGMLIAKWRRRGRELGFGAGIAQGYATLGQIGFAERSGYTAIGTVCNLASRLCAEAKDGQILVAQRVAVSVEDTMVLEEVGALALKGLIQPVVAYNVPLVGSQAGFRVIEGGAPTA